MHIAFLPAGTPDAASSRIRVYNLQRALQEMGFAATRGYSPKADVLMIQKRVTSDALDTARKAKAQGGTVIYDIDDIAQEALGNWVQDALLDEMLSLADLVTTDTAGHMDQLRTIYGIDRVQIVPDSIDYYPIEPAHFPLKGNSPFRVMWFGNLANLGMFEKYTDILLSLPNVEIVVVTGSYGTYGMKGESKRYVTKYPKITFLPWSRATFVQILQSCQLTCLMHDGSEFDQAKSNNKMITSIAWGVPAVVSRTVEYERTAKEAEISHAVFSNDDELCRAIDSLRSPQTRADYLSVAQPAIWARYSPKAVAKAFLNIVASLSSSRLISAKPTNLR